MKKGIIFKFFTFLMMVLAFNLNSQAQIKGILNKAKKAAKDEINKGLNKEKDKVNDNVQDAYEDSDDTYDMSDGVPDDYDELLGGSKKALLDSYDNLDYNVYHVDYMNSPEIFYKDYDETNKYYANLRYFISGMMSSGESSPAMVYYTRNNITTFPPDIIINASFALFNAFPKTNYITFVEGRTMLKAIKDGRISTDITDMNTIACSFDDKVESYYLEFSDDVRFGSGFRGAFVLGFSDDDSYDEQLKLWQKEEERLYKKYLKEVPFETVQSTFENLLVAASTKGDQYKDYNGAMQVAYMLEVIYQDVINHPNPVKSENYNMAIALYKKFADESFFAWEEKNKDLWVNRILANLNFPTGKGAIPKAKMHDSKLEADFLRIAKDIYDDGRVPVEAIIISNGWSYTYGPLGNIIDRYMSAMIIYKEVGGTYRMVDIGLKQVYNGSSYGKSQLRGIGLTNQPIDYE